MFDITPDTPHPQRIGYPTELADGRDHTRRPSRPSVRRTLPRRSRRVITPADTADLLAACAADPDATRGHRDAAIIAVLVICGLRAREVCGLELSDWDPDTASLKIRTVKARGRWAILTPEAAAYLCTWLECRDAPSGPLFPALRLGTELGPLDAQQLGRLLRTRAVQAHVEPVGCYDFRETLARRLYAPSLSDLAPCVLSARPPADPGPAPARR